MLELTRKNNHIDFQLQTENVNIQETKVRLLVEVDGNITVHPLKLPLSGHVQGRIPMNEAYHNKSGKIFIEVVAEDTYFKLHEQEVKFNCPSLKKNVQISEVKFEAKDVEDDGVIAPEPVNESWPMSLATAVRKIQDNPDTEVPAKYAGRPVTIIKHDPSDEMTWTVKFPNGKEVSFAETLSNIRLEGPDPAVPDNSDDSAVQQLDLFESVDEEEEFDITQDNGWGENPKVDLASETSILDEQKDFFSSNKVDKKFQDAEYEAPIRYTMEHVRELRSALKPGHASRVKLTEDNRIQVTDSGRDEIMDTIYETADRLHLKPWHMEFATEFPDSKYVNESEIYDDVFAALNAGEVSKPKAKKKVVTEEKVVEVKINKSLEDMLKQGTTKPVRSINEFFNPEPLQETDTKALRRKMKLDNMSEEISLSKLL